MSVPAAQSLLVTLQDSTSTDVVAALRQARGAADSVELRRELSQVRVRPSPQLLVPSAAPGTWYILVEANSVPVGEQLPSPDRRHPHPVDRRGPGPGRRRAPRRTLTLTGSGFDGSTTVELVSASNTVYQASPRIARHADAVDGDVQPERRAAGRLFGRGDQGGQPQLRALPGRSPWRPTGRRNLVTHLILPADDGAPRLLDDLRRVREHGDRGDPGTAAGAAAPEQPQDQPLLHAQPGAGGLGLLDLGPAAGILQHRRDPGQRHGGPGLARAGRIASRCRSTTPGCSSPGLRPTRHSSSSWTSTRRRTRLRIDWSSMESSLQPPGLSSQAWSAIFSGLTSPARQHVRRLRDDAGQRGDLPGPARRGRDRRQSALGARRLAGRRPHAHPHAGERQTRSHVAVPGPGARWISPSTIPSRSARETRSVRSATAGPTTGSIRCRWPPTAP